MKGSLEAPGKAFPQVQELITKYGDLQSRSNKAAATMQGDFANTAKFVDDLTEHVGRAIKKINDLATALVRRPPVRHGCS